jgi:hypothetical protein
MLVRTRTICAAFVPALVLAALPAAATAADISVQVVNQRGTPQGGVYVQDLEGPKRTDAYGRAVVKSEPGKAVTADRGRPFSGCAAPESAQGGVSAIVPDPAPAQMTIVVPQAVASTPTTDLTIDERWVLGKVNQERRAKKFTPLRVSTALSRAADAQARDLSSNFVAFDDPCPFGANAVVVAMDAGFLPGSTLRFPINPPPREDGEGTSADDALDAYKSLDRDYDAVGIANVGDYWVLYASQTRYCTPGTFGAERCEMTNDTGDPTLPHVDLDPDAPLNPGKKPRLRVSAPRLAGNVVTLRVRWLTPSAAKHGVLKVRATRVFDGEPIKMRATRKGANGRSGVYTARLTVRGRYDLAVSYVADDSGKWRSARITAGRVRVLSGLAY